MANKRRRQNGWEYTVKRKGVLEKPLYLTFRDEAEGDAYVARLEAMLDRGIVPGEHQVERAVRSIADLVQAYSRDAHPSKKDESALATIVAARGSTLLQLIDAAWVDEWISHLKRVDKLAPATIRAKVGALARCTDWGIRKKHLVMPDHPMRTLPDGYSQYTKADAAEAGVLRKDIERDRRLEPGEHERILATIDAGVLPRKQRPYELPHPAALKLFYIVALESAMRMREIYTLSIEQIDVQRRTIFLDKTKNGDKRQVPMSSVLTATLAEYLPARPMPEGRPEQQVFPWWNGDHGDKSLWAASDYLSGLFTMIFEHARCANLRFHDLRHEATSRLYERTKLTDLQISKITGHRSLQMLRRYANLRASEVAAALW